jgi:cytochrome c
MVAAERSRYNGAETSSGMQVYCFRKPLTGEKCGRVLAMSMMLLRSAARIACTLTLLAVVAAQGECIAADAKAGAVVFARCAICHSRAKGAPDQIGPNLFGVVGRKAGSRPGFYYSAAMKNAGFAWTPDRLKAFVTDPAHAVPGNRMAFFGIRDPQQDADVVAYLATLK